MKKGKSGITFDASFEGGNLDLVIQTGENEFDLYMRIDTNTKGHNSWFNFNILTGETDQLLKINIVNFTKSNTMFLRGHRPFYKSKKAGNDWI